MRTRLDGSDPTILLTGIENPNGVAIADGYTFVIDSRYKTREANGKVDPVMYRSTPGNNEWSSWSLKPMMTVTIVVLFNVAYLYNNLIK